MYSTIPSIPVGPLVLPSLCLWSILDARVRVHVELSRFGFTLRVKLSAVDHTALWSY
jgi:hypothetical protein